MIANTDPSIRAVYKGLHDGQSWHALKRVIAWSDDGEPLVVSDSRSGGLVRPTMARVTLAWTPKTTP